MTIKIQTDALNKQSSQERKMDMICIRLPKILFAMLAVFATVTQTGLAEDEASEWIAGSSFVVITPDKPMWMAGYASRNKPSEGTALDLYAKALVLQDKQGNRGAIITLDLISVPRPLRDAVAARVQKRYRIPASSLMMNCSHTHCGPELRTTESSYEGLDQEREKQAKEYASQLEEKLVALVGAALANSIPSKLTYCRSRAAFAMNRRLPTDSGFRNSPNPAGPVDHDVPVLKVVGNDGELKTLLFGYACHNTTIGIYEFCGDYAGYAQQYLEASHPGVVAMFVEGCGGDQNPYPRRTIELARIHGKTLATAVDAALQTPQLPVEGPLRIALKDVTVNYAKPPSKKELTERLESKNRYLRRHAERLLGQLKQQGKIRTSYKTLVQSLRFGDDLTMIALPGETVVDYSLRLKKELAGTNVWVAGYSNDVFAYVPSKRVLEEGGYEGGGAMIYMTTVVQPGPFTSDIESRIIEGVKSTLAETDQAAHQIHFQPALGFLKIPRSITLGRCSAVAIDSQHRIYLFHRGKHPIICFDSKGNYIRSWGDDLIGMAHGLRIDRDDNVWVTDIGHHMVMKFDPTGKLLMALGQNGKPGIATDQFNKPTDIAFDSRGSFYISDGYGNSRVMKFSADGQLVRQWGTPGKSHNEFDLPHSIVVDKNDRIIVGDRENDRVQIFNTEGKLLDVWDGFAPYGMEIDHQGTLFVADGRANQVLQIDEKGNIVQAWGKKGDAIGQFNLPHMLAADRFGNLHIAEVGNERVQTLLRK